jgi:hypothetical protein
MNNASNGKIEQQAKLNTSRDVLAAEEAAWRLGFSPHEIPILVAKNLLKPLGHSPHNDPKHFLAADVESLRRDEEWHSKAAGAVMEHWQYKNHRKQDLTDAREPAPAQT